MNPSQFIDGRDLRIAALERKNKALAARVAVLESALREAADELDDYSPLTGNAIETSASRRARAKLEGLNDEPY